jgi:RNA polymerase sigma-70 factor (ECF subfamily)
MIGGYENAIENMKADDIEAFWCLVKPYRKGMQITAYCMLDSSNEAEEVVSATLSKAFETLLQPRDGMSLKAWIQTITIDECRLRVREGQEEIEPHEGTVKNDGLCLPCDPVAWNSVECVALESKEVWKSVYSALKSVIPCKREVFILRDIQHFSLAETAKILRIGEDQVLQRLHGARLEMRERLDPLFRREAPSTCL